MGKRILAAVIVLITILAGLIYFEDKYAGVKTAPTDGAVSQPVTSDADNRTKMLRSVEVAASAKVSEKNVSADTQKGADEVEKAPVTFGYIAHGDKIQIVGLMSRQDETGVLKGYLDRLSQERNCSVEVDYRDNIMDAPWQRSLVDLFGLMQSDDFENGALFIESGHITLEGQVQKEDTKKRIADILNQLHEEGLEIVPSALVKSLHHTKSHEQNSTTVRQVSENNISLKSNEANLSSIVKKETSPQPKHHRRKNGEVILFHKAKKKEQRHKTEVAKKRSMKKSVQRRKKYQKDIVAPSYMETTIDLERKVKSGKVVEDESEIVVFEEDKTPDDMIAKPKFTIMK